jgi:uncharacterized membrane protein
VAKRVTRVLLAVLFVGAGVAHFVRPGPYVAIVPPALPAPEVLVAVSGAAEVVGGIALLVPALRRAAGVGLIALLLAVYPANVYMAVADVPLGRFRLPWWGHAIRLPIQFVLVALVAWASGLWRGPPRGNAGVLSPGGAADGSQGWNEVEPLARRRRKC